MRTQGRTSASGVVIGLTSACLFGTSGAFAKPLLESGWSSAAAVTVRIGVAALLLAIPALFALRGQWGVVRQRWRPIVMYGLFGGAMVQVAYFYAIQYIDVGVALLFEYLGVVLVVLWAWLATRHPPGALTLLGMVTAIGGLAVVLNPADLATTDPRGIAWAALASFGMAVYYVTSAETLGIPPVAFVASGLGVGTLSLLLAGAVGLVPMVASTADVHLFGGVVPWWVPLLELAVGAAALAYLSGFVAARRLGATAAGFLGLTEVLFAVLWAWLLLGQLPGWVQLVGGLVLLVGVAGVQWGNARQA